MKDKMVDILKKIIPFAIGACILAAAIYGAVRIIQPPLEFKSIQQKTTAENFAEGIAPIKSKLDYEVWDHYTQIDGDTALNESLCLSLQEAKNAEEFAEKFKTAVEQVYWSGYELHLNNKTQLSGLRGTLTLHGENIPAVTYGIVKTFDANNAPLETITAELHNGTGYYNLFENSQKAPIYKTEVYVAADKDGKEPLTAVSTQATYPVEIPEIFISEVANQPSYTYYPDPEEGPHNDGSAEQKFQYVELYNYSDAAVDLSELTLFYSDQLGQHKFEWITEAAGSTVIEPKSVYIIGVYAADSALAGYTYDTDAGLTQYWTEFNNFYNTKIDGKDRALIACVKSGDAQTTLDGIDRLNTSTTAGETVSVQINRGNECIAKAVLEDDKPFKGYAQQFLPTSKGATEEFLFSTGCFPGALLTEQDLTYCETATPVDADIIKTVTYNILATDDNPAEKQGPVQYRSELFFRFMEDYQPDIIGLQEVNFRWTPLLQERMAELGYGEIQGVSSADNTYENVSKKNEWELMNPIYYRTDRFELLDSGHAFLTPDGKVETQPWDSIHGPRRVITWAVLKDKNTGDVFNHINTHLTLSGKVARVEQVKILYNTVSELQKKYGGSIIITGDHNMEESTEPYQAYINSGLVVDSKYQTTNHNSLATYTNFDSDYNEQYGAPIDFCFISPELKVSKYEVFGGRYADGTISDHSAVLTELYLQK